VDSSGASLLDRLEETSAEFLFGVPTHAIDLLSEMRARGARHAGAVRGFRISGAAAPAPVVGRVDAARYRTAERLRHDRNLLAPIHARPRPRPARAHSYDRRRRARNDGAVLVWVGGLHHDPRAAAPATE
jgi:hypothetical protein